jgi:hypothetical protein
MAIPRAERSGSHRVVDVEVGDVRQVIAALAGVATLARAQGVGPRALRDALPELRTACIAAPAVVAGALLPACDVVALSTGLETEARAALDQIVLVTRQAVTEVAVAAEIAEKKGVGARTRLGLQGACDAAVEVLARVRWAVELVQRASMGEPVPVALDDLLCEIDGGELGGTSVELIPTGIPDVAVAVHPRVATSVLLGLLAELYARTQATTYALTARTGEGKLVLEVRPGPSRPPRDAEPIRVIVPPPAAFDPVVVNLAAATLAAPIHRDGDSISIQLPRA